MEKCHVIKYPNNESPISLANLSIVPFTFLISEYGICIIVRITTLTISFYPKGFGAFQNTIRKQGIHPYIVEAY